MIQMVSLNWGYLKINIKIIKLILIILLNVKESTKWKNKWVINQSMFSITEFLAEYYGILLLRNFYYVAGVICEIKLNEISYNIIRI